MRQGKRLDNKKKMYNKNNKGPVYLFFSPTASTYWYKLVQNEQPRTICQWHIVIPPIWSTLQLLTPNATALCHIGSPTTEVSNELGRKAELTLCSFQNALLCLTFGVTKLCELHWKIYIYPHLISVLKQSAVERSLLSLGLLFELLSQRETYSLVPQSCCTLLCLSVDCCSPLFQGKLVLDDDDDDERNCSSSELCIYLLGRKSPYFKCLTSGTALGLFVVMLFCEWSSEQIFLGSQEPSQVLLSANLKVKIHHWSPLWSSELMSHHSNLAPRSNRAVLQMNFIS